MLQRYLPLALALLLAAPDPLAQQAFDPRPTAGSLATTGASFDHPRLDDFFTETDYVGAFAPGGSRWDLPWANYDPQNTDYGDPANVDGILEGTISASRTISGRWLMRGFVQVVEPAILTIEPGTIIFGDEQTKATLIINRGAKINAVGTPDQPIVFTSERAMGDRQGGDWGGIIVAGRARINTTSGEFLIEGGTGAVGGGTNDDDDSGTMRYVRAEFAGIEFGPDNEINTFTFAGVGRNTRFEYLQASYCDDDCFEWFGGSLDNRYLIALAGLDDDFDGDLGWRGRVQFGLVVRDPDLADISGSNGFEQDGGPTEAEGQQLPRSAPTFSNITVLGPLLFEEQANINTNYRRGAHIRRGSRFSLFNSVVLGFPVGVRMDNPSVAADAQAGELALQNNIISGPIQSGEASFDAAAWLATPTFGNRLVGSPEEVAFANIGGLPFFVSSEGGPAGASTLVLEAAYPNPASGQVTLAFSLEAPQHARLAVYDLLGREVAVVTDALAPADKSAFSLDVSGLASGLYLVRLQTEQGAATQRLTVAR